MMRHHALHAIFFLYLLSVSVSIFLCFFSVSLLTTMTMLILCLAILFHNDEHIARNYSLLRHWVFTRRWFFSLWICNFFFSFNAVALETMRKLHLNTDSIFIDAFKLILHSSFYLCSVSIVDEQFNDNNGKKTICSSNFSLGNWLSILEWHCWLQQRSIIHISFFSLSRKTTSQFESWFLSPIFFFTSIDIVQ